MTKTSQTQKAEVKTVKLPNGQEAPLLVADLNKDIKMAIVSQNILKFLTSLLPNANLSGIVQEFAMKLEEFNLKAVNKQVTIEDYINLLCEELEFNESVNLIKEFYAEENPIVEPVNVVS